MTLLWLPREHRDTALIDLLKGTLKMYRPMPSPNGTNFEQLYISVPGPTMAFDQAPSRSRARDQEEDDTLTAEEVIENVKYYLRKMDRDEASAAMQMLASLVSEQVPGGNDSRSRRIAADQAARRSRFPTDSDGFHRRFPNAKRIGRV